MINVLIVDDHALVRMGISRLLEDLPDIHVVGEAQNGEEALALIKAKKPDVVLLDMKMPGLDGWEVTRRLHTAKTIARVRVIVLTSLTSDPLPAKLLQLGAMGYLTKDSCAQDIAQAIRTVARGEKFLSASIAQQIALGSLNASQQTPFAVLSEREMQVLLMITRGMNVPMIAEQLFLSTKTVNGYRYRMFEKLGVKNDVALTYLAIQHRIIELPAHAAHASEEVVS